MAWKPTKIIPKPFEVTVNLTRPTNTNTYTIGDLVNSSGLAVLPTLDFSGLIDMTYAGPYRIQIISAIIKSDYGLANPKLQAQVWLFNRNDIQADCADEVVFAPTAVIHKANCTGRLDDMTYGVSVGANAYEVIQSEISRIATLDNAGKLYPAIVASNAYVGKSAELISLTLKGFLLFGKGE